jgi:tetratricopeptide (TPR) repeat protein
MSLISQEMQIGFDHLEKGRFKEAVDFFEETLTQYPENRTARLCYARALGLHNDPKSATELFLELEEDYPTDQEIKINLAESYLWNGDYKTGQSLYSKLHKEMPDNMGVLIGLSNSYALQTRYKEAYDYLKKALAIDPNNIGASTSMQYARLGLANEAIQRYDYTSAEQILNENLDLPVDLTPTYLTQANLALNQNDTKTAHRIFKKIFEADNSNLLSLNGLSLTNYLLDHNKKSRQYTNQAMTILQGTEDIDSNIRSATTLQYLQSLIWNHDYSIALAETNSYLDQKYIDTTAATSITTRAAMQQKKFTESLDGYKKLTKMDSDNAEGWIGTVQSLIALDRLSMAREMIPIAKENIGQHPTLNNLTTQVNNAFSPSADTHTWYNTDSGNDQAINFEISPTIPIGKRLSFLTNYRYRNTWQSGNNSSTIHAFQAGLRYRLKAHTHLSGLFGFVDNQGAMPSFNNMPAINIDLKTKINDKHPLEIGYRSGVLDYNTNLISNAISNQTGYLKYGFSTLKGFGIYTEVNQNFLSDSNRNIFAFLSLYQQIKRIPFIKLGVNTQYLSFNEEVPLSYFSPDKFYAGELFMDIVRSDDMFLGKGITYLITIAGGIQSINSETSTTYRTNASIGYRWNSGITLSLYGLRSNVASSSIGGFTYNQFGIRTKLFLEQK